MGQNSSTTILDFSLLAVVLQTMESWLVVRISHDSIWFTHQLGYATDYGMSQLP